MRSCTPPVAGSTCSRWSRKLARTDGCLASQIDARTVQRPALKFLPLGPPPSARHARIQWTQYKNARGVAGQRGVAACAWRRGACACFRASVHASVRAWRRAWREAVGPRQWCRGARAQRACVWRTDDLIGLARQVVVVQLLARARALGRLHRRRRLHWLDLQREARHVLQLVDVDPLELALEEGERRRVRDRNLDQLVEAVGLLDLHLRDDLEAPIAELELVAHVVLEPLGIRHVHDV
eukprot:5023143-Prymnesium_polylepis.2